MSELKIITNNHWRQFKYREEVPENILSSDFDYLNEEDSIDGFFCYRGTWHHLSEYMRIENHSDKNFSSWHGYASDSFFSGTVIRVSEDCEMYQIGLYLS